MIGYSVLRAAGNDEGFFIFGMCLEYVMELTKNDTHRQLISVHVRYNRS